jgi:hypothetical protein
VCGEEEKFDSPEGASQQSGVQVLAPPGRRGAACLGTLPCFALFVSWVPTGGWREGSVVPRINSEEGLQASNILIWIEHKP